jgi:8-oxo-dGTP pyrophosphatase MutT (NUDIX family)
MDAELIARTGHFRERLIRALTLSTISTAWRNHYAPELSYGRHFAPPLADMRQGAVLVLFHPSPIDWNVTLTVRTTHLPAHAGQVSFPGGRIETGETPEQAALREYEEELGSLDACEIVGQLPNVNVYASNFLVTPTVALTRDKPLYRPNADEVADVIELPLAALADRTRRGSHEIVRGPLRFRTSHLQVAGRNVWGATWIILGELLERLEALGPVTDPGNLTD